MNTQKLVAPFVVFCTNQEEWDEAHKLLKEVGYVWYDGKQPTTTRYLQDGLGSVLYVEDGQHQITGYSDLEFYSLEYPSGKYNEYVLKPKKVYELSLQASLSHVIIDGVEVNREALKAWLEVHTI